MAKPKYTTFTGVKAEDIPAKMAERFPNEAYKGVPGGADLTDINTGFMIERLTQVFGPKGLGWNLICDTSSLRIGDSNRPLARMDATFTYALWDDKDQRLDCAIQVSGVNQNDSKYVEEGVRTSATGAAIKWLCFQLDIFKGQFDHHDAQRDADNARKAAAANNKPAQGTKPTTQAPAGNGNGTQKAAAYVPEQWTPETAAEVVTPKKTKIGSLNTDDLSKFIAGVDVAKKENKPEAIDNPELDRAYDAAKFLVAHRTATAK